MDDRLTQLATLLDQRSVLANYQAGLLLTTMQEVAGPTHGKKFIDGISEQLKPVCKIGPTSPNHLLKCRKLAEEWPQDLIDTLNGDVPWHIIVKTLFALSQAKSVGAEVGANEIEKIERHLRQFPKTKRGNEVKNWMKTLTRIKNEYAARLGTGGQLKQLQEARDAIDVRLRDARDRMQRVRKLMTPEQIETLDVAVEATIQLAKDSRALIDMRLKELRREAKSESCRA